MRDESVLTEEERQKFSYTPTWTLEEQQVGVLECALSLYVAEGGDTAYNLHFLEFVQREAAKARVMKREREELLRRRIEASVDA